MYRTKALKTAISATIVEPYESHVYIIPSALKRKVIMMHNMERLLDPCQFLVIDCLRSFPITASKDVIVSYYPQDDDRNTRFR